jgi:muramidase (phage lysozyme)
MARLSECEAGGRNVLAFLDMIAVSEGTDDGRQATKDGGYDVLVGGKLFSSYKTHPGILTRLRPGLSSTAAGRYQFLKRTWDEIAKAYQLRDFSPENQDRGAIALLRRRKALEDVKSGRWEDAMAKAAKEWASIPGAGYGQHEQKPERLRMAYAKAGGTFADTTA